MVKILSLGEKDWHNYFITGKKWALLPNIPIFKCAKTLSDRIHLFRPTSPKNDRVDICFEWLSSLDEVLEIFLARMQKLFRQVATVMPLDGTEWFCSLFFHFSCSEWKWRWEVKETKSCHLSATVMSLDRSIKMFAFHQIERRLCNCSLLTELQRWWWFPFLMSGLSENHPEKCNTLFPKCITTGKVQLSASKDTCVKVLC